jgi:hypothetical protein
LKEEEENNPHLSLFQLLENRNFPEIRKNDIVSLYLLDGIDLAAVKLSANKNLNSSYIQQLC